MLLFNFQPTQMSKILVTGGAGFIGSHVVDLLVQNGHQVVVLDDLSLGKRTNLSPQAKLIVADLRSPNTATRVIYRVKPVAVIHLAAQANVRKSIVEPSFDAMTNIVGGINLLKACTDSQVPRVVFASSGGAIYGEQTVLPISETALPKAVSPYGLAKQTLERYGQYFHESAGMEFVSLRLANVYGPRQSTKGEAGVVSIFMDCLAKDRQPTIFGDGSHTRDYVWVGDVARAFLAALTGPIGTYNIGTGIETQTIDLFEKLRELSKSDLSPIHSREIRGEVHRNALDYRRARTRLKWSPVLSLSEGLVETMRFFKLGNSIKREASLDKWH